MVYVLKKADFHLQTVDKYIHKISVVQNGLIYLDEVCHLSNNGNYYLSLIILRRNITPGALWLFSLQLPYHQARTIKIIDCESIDPAAIVRANLSSINAATILINEDFRIKWSFYMSSRRRERHFEPVYFENFRILQLEDLQKSAMIV